MSLTNMSLVDVEHVESSSEGIGFRVTQCTAPYPHYGGMVVL